MDALGEREESPGDNAARLTRAVPASFQDYAANRLVGRWTGLRARLMLFVTAVLLGPLGLVGYETSVHVP